eukprot:SAG22_NODE_76_length_22248_cov_14.352070_16_plen_142_part_00
MYEAVAAIVPSHSPPIFRQCSDLSARRDGAPPATAPLRAAQLLRGGYRGTRQMASDGAPVLDDALEAAPAGHDDGHTANDVAISAHGYGSGAEDEDDDPDAAADGGDTPAADDAHQQDRQRILAPGRPCAGPLPDTLIHII